MRFHGILASNSARPQNPVIPANSNLMEFEYKVAHLALRGAESAADARGIKGEVSISDGQALAVAAVEAADFDVDFTNFR